MVPSQLASQAASQLACQPASSQPAQKASQPAPRPPSWPASQHRRASQAQPAEPARPGQPLTKADKPQRRPSKPDQPSRPTVPCLPFHCLLAGSGLHRIQAHVHTRSTHNWFHGSPLPNRFRGSPLPRLPALTHQVRESQTCFSHLAYGSPAEITGNDADGFSVAGTPARPPVSGSSLCAT